MAEEWQPGDRVAVRLPDYDAPRARGGAVVKAWIGGTVRDIDPPGLPPGVRVDLDRAVNGVCDCYAAHAELRRSDHGEPGMSALP